MGTVITEKGKAMSEYIVRETGYPGTLKQEIVEELVRCKDCKYCAIYHYYDGDISVCARMYQFRRVLFDVTADKDFCSKAEKRDAER